MMFRNIPFLTGMLALVAFTSIGCDRDSSSRATTGPADGHEEAHLEHGEHADEVKLTPEGVMQFGIRIEPVAKRMLIPTLVAPAHVTFNEEAVAHVGSLVRGRVVELKRRVGDVVKKGDELLAIESMELGEAQSDYLQRRAAATVAEGSLRPLQQAYERSKSLYEENGSIALGEVQKREAEFLAAKGTSITQGTAAAAARDKLLLLGMEETQISELEKGGKLSPRHFVRAPIAGRVIEREVTLGELVSPEKEKLLVLADTEMLWVIAQVPEAQLAEIIADAVAQVQVGASPEKLAGKVSLIGTEMNAGTRTGSVRIELPNPKGNVRPGMFGRVELQLSSGLGERVAVLAVPDAALQTFEGGTVVFAPVEGEENTFAPRSVTCGEAVGGMVPVLSGLKDGDPVVVAGAFILKAELGKGGAGHQH